ncbi:MAG: hypothetical protein ACO1RT_00815 [Planctomycetaceae bacterium]
MTRLTVARTEADSPQQWERRSGRVVTSPVGFAYALARRAGLFEATRLLVGSWPREPSAWAINDRYRYAAPTADQLQQLLDERRCPPEIGSSDALLLGNRRVITATINEHVVGFAWAAIDCVNADENFSRTRALGTAIKLPESMAFIFNAWVAPSHRGQALLASMIFSAADRLWTDVSQMATTMDWTNHASCAAFKKLGLREVGMIARYGVGRLQWISAPPEARELGISCSVR